MKKIVLFLLTLVFATGAIGETNETLRKRTFNLDSEGVVLKGYDPVSYHEAGPQKDKVEFSAVYKGGLYRFVSQSNLDDFQDNADQYEPAYGGGCASRYWKASKSTSIPKPSN